MTRISLPGRRAWRASFTRRWHANPDLCHTVDPVGAHSARMGILALQLWPLCSRDLLRACLVHDLGECATGDIPWPARRDPELRAALDRIEACALADMGMLHDLCSLDERRLRYLDRLDAYMWAEHHRPDIMDDIDWRDARAWLDCEWAAIQAEAGE